MRKLNLLTSAAAVGVVVATGSSAFAASLITLQGSDLAASAGEVTYSTSPTLGGTAGYVPPNAVLTVLNAGSDSAQITISNGYTSSAGTVELGTLSTLLAAGASYDNLSQTGVQTSPPPNLYSYWVVTLANGDTLNSFSDNTLGSNPFGPASMGTSTCTGTCTGFNGFSAFSNQPASYLSSDVDSVTIEIGGFGGSQAAQTETIDSVTLPGDLPAPTPLPATLALFAGGLGVLGLLARRRKQSAQAAA
jgi:hypothetical protein